MKRIFKKLPNKIPDGYSVYYIYKITNLLNNKQYIGQHKKYKSDYYDDSYMGKGVAITAAIKKYGRKNFKKEILEYIIDDEKHELVSQREIYYISFFDTQYPIGYNLTPGGEGGCTKEAAKKVVETKRKNGYKMSEETKMKISIANKGKKKSEIHKQHLSENHHLLKEWTIHHEDGTIEECGKINISKYCNDHGINFNALMRKSAKGEYINGVKVSEEVARKYKCTEKPPKKDLPPDWRKTAAKKAAETRMKNGYKPSQNTKDKIRQNNLKNYGKLNLTITHSNGQKEKVKYLTDELIKPLRITMVELLDASSEKNYKYGFIIENITKEISNSKNYTKYIVYDLDESKYVKYRSVVSRNSRNKHKSQYKKIELEGKDGTVYKFLIGK